MPPKLLHPFGKPAAQDYRNIVKTEGVRLYDDQGREYIDALGSLWYCQVGHGRTEIVDAVADQLSRAAYNVFAPFANDAPEQLAERVTSLSPLPDGRVYLCCSGSESIDSAMKIARGVAQLKGEPDRQIIVRRGRGYHGVNFGGTSVQGIPSNREGWGDLLPHIVEIDPDNIESAASLFAEHGSRIAAVISEPVQGAGGVHLPVEGYFERLRDLCTQHGALLVHDEVITGFGRTGSWFASQTFGVTPDLITFAKGVTSGYQPLGGVIASRAVCDVLESDPDYVFRHGHTYSGHPAAAAAGLANIDIIEQEGLVERANHVGRRFAAGFAALVGDGELASYRGVGAMWGARMVGDDFDQGLAVRDQMLEAGIIIRSIDNTIAFCPPLVIPDADIDHCIDVMATAIRDVTGN